MRIAIVGGGPAGLYFGYLMRRHGRAEAVRVFEQNPADATFGFGVVFSDRALEFLSHDDPETYRYLLPEMESWPDLCIVHRGERVEIDGNGFAAIGRLALLRLLQARCLEVGVEIGFGQPIETLDEVGEADLVVGADGVNSIVRRDLRRAIGTSEASLSNRFAWYGTTKTFDCLTLTFRPTEDGVFIAHHYRYSPTMSTFLVECDSATWERAGFQAMDDAASRAYCEAVFAADLEGHSLLSNNSVWRRFPLIQNRRWSARNAVLLGDALRTAHFSIGSGTRLAMEDAIALWKALEAHGNDVDAALEAFEASRRPPVEKIVAASVRSARWYEEVGTRMALSPLDFAHAYMTRTGRVGDARLQRIAPRFMARYLAR
ncbi:MAG: FAD-dependent monooxygenase [Alphaproteobacteria bacterium]|nr:FAD-dependent monooxygenase [Alphaproteobacteria bacterium]